MERFNTTKEPFEEQKKAFPIRADIIEKQPKPLQEYEQKIETEKRLDKAMPEPEPPEFKSEPVEATIILTGKDKDGKTEVSVIREPKAEKKTFTIQRNPNIRLIMNLSSCKLYYDIDKNQYFLYVFSQDHKTMMRKIPIAKHDIYGMLAFSIAEIYGEKLLKLKKPEIYVTEQLREKIKEILTNMESEPIEQAEMVETETEPSAIETLWLGLIEAYLLESINEQH